MRGEGVEEERRGEGVRSEDGSSCPVSNSVSSLSCSAGVLTSSGLSLFPDQSQLPSWERGVVAKGEER